MVDKGKFTFEEVERHAVAVDCIPELDVCVVGGTSDGGKREVRHGRCQRNQQITNK